MGLIPHIEESEATGEVVELYEEIKRVTGAPFVSNLDKALAASPNMLRAKSELVRHVFIESNLPQTVVAMIFYAIATANQCGYCGPSAKVTCRTVGVDEETLSALVGDLQALAPRRVQETIKFAKKCATDTANVSQQDFDHVRQQGVSDEEIMEVISIAATANFLTTIADSVKVELDDAIAEALGG